MIEKEEVEKMSAEVVRKGSKQVIEKVVDGKFEVEIEETTIKFPKNVIEFLKEFAEWSGQTDLDKFINDFVVYAVETNIQRVLDDMQQTNELLTKVDYFKKKYRI